MKARASSEGKNGQGQGQGRARARARASKGEGKETETRNETRRTEKIVMAQQARKSLHSQESHMEMRGNKATVAFCILSILI